MRSGRRHRRFALRQTDDDSYDVTVGTQTWLQSATLDVALACSTPRSDLRRRDRADRIFVHAGVVAVGRRALVIPRELLGQDDVGDSARASRRDLLLRRIRGTRRHRPDPPISAPLSIRRDGTNSTQERRVSELGGVAGVGTAEVATVVITRYRPGATWQPKRLPRGHGSWPCWQTRSGAGTSEGFAAGRDPGVCWSDRDRERSRRVRDTRGRVA